MDWVSWVFGSLFAVLIAVVIFAAVDMALLQARHRREVDETSGAVRVFFSAWDGLYHVERAVKEFRGAFGGMSWGITWWPAGEYGDEAEAVARAERLRRGDRFVGEWPATTEQP